MTQSIVFAVRRQLRGVEVFFCHNNIGEPVMLFGISFETYLAVGKAIIGIVGIILPLLSLF
ncbi:hypothetical protein [Rhodococcus sp. MALMAid1271]|uniref:hypothetical protein n=1 Tax=Rhodococcus sp. MALMAid1271 TaxID=3411744 RepID=UPI003B9FD460